MDGCACFKNDSFLLSQLSSSFFLLPSSSLATTAVANTFFLLHLSHCSIGLDYTPLVCQLPCDVLTGWPSLYKLLCQDTTDDGSWPSIQTIHGVD